MNCTAHTNLIEGAEKRPPIDPIYIIGTCPKCSSGLTYHREHVGGRGDMGILDCTACPFTIRDDNPLWRRALDSNN